MGRRSDHAPRSWRSSVAGRPSFFVLRFVLRLLVVRPAHSCRPLPWRAGCPWGWGRLRCARFPRSRASASRSVGVPSVAIQRWDRTTGRWTNSRRRWPTVFSSRPPRRSSGVFLLLAAGRTGAHTAGLLSPRIAATTQPYRIDRIRRLPCLLILLSSCWSPLCSRRGCSPA